MLEGKDSGKKQSRFLEVLEDYRNHWIKKTTKNKTRDILTSSRPGSSDHKYSDGGGGGTLVRSCGLLRTLNQVTRRDATAS